MKRLQFRGFAINNIADDFYKILPPKKGKSKSGYYFLSNDLIQSVEIPRYKCARVFIGVANPHCLHAIYFASKNNILQRIVLIDNNLSQLVHFTKLINLIKSNTTRQSFVHDLFCVEQNPHSAKILKSAPTDESIARGGEADNLVGFEAKFWSSVSFNKPAFEKRYGLKAKRINKGILINAHTMGNINKYYATVFCGSRKDFKYWPFTAGFGTGYLATNSCYQRLREIVLNTPIYLIHDDMPNAIKDVVASNKYTQIILWLSNLKAFEKGNSSIFRMFKYINRYDIGIVMEDARVKKSFSENASSFGRKLIKTIRKEPAHRVIHKNSFSAVMRHLIGPENLEIVNVAEWIQKDNKISKLPNTNYILASNYLKKPALKNKKFSSIFLHILLGHGISFDDFTKIAKKARNETGNLIILEHNQNSPDFKATNVGTTPTTIRKTLGKESSLEYLPGYKSQNRNFIMLYRINNKD